jgi:hypothetical protein
VVEVNKTGTRAVPDDGRKVVPIARNSLGTLGELEVLYAFCRRCKRDRKLDVPALFRRYGDLHLRRLRARLRCSTCGAREAEIIRATTLPGPKR